MDYQNHVFVNEVVELDGNAFTACTFEDCTIHYAGGIVKIVGPTNFAGKTSINMVGAAKAPWQVFVWLLGGLGVDVSSVAPRIKH